MEPLAPLDRLKATLEERGIQASLDTRIFSENLRVSLIVNKFYGVESELPDGGIVRIMIRGVEQAPGSYYDNMSPDSEEYQRWLDSQMHGILADAQVYSTNRRHIHVARRMVLQMQNRDGGINMNSTSFKQWGIGKFSEQSSVLNFEIPDIANAREMGMAAMDYSEPGTVKMILAALKLHNR